MQPLKPVERYLLNTFIRSELSFITVSPWGVNVPTGTYYVPNPFRYGRRLDIAPSIGYQLLKAFRITAYGYFEKPDELLLDNPFDIIDRDVTYEYWMVMK